MKPILLIPIVVGMMVMPSSRMLDAPKPLTPADLLTRSYATQMSAPRGEPSVSEVRAAEYALRYTVYDEHHEPMQTSGHSGVVGSMRMM